MARVSHPTPERLEPHTEEPAMREHFTDVAFDMHQASLTAAWLMPSAGTPELRTIPHEPKPFRRLLKEILAHGQARVCYETGPCA